MKEHEKYAEEVFKQVKTTYKWVDDDFPIDLWRDHRDIAIWYIQGQIEAIMSLELPKSDYAVKVEYLQKSIDYLKEKL